MPAVRGLATASCPFAPKGLAGDELDIDESLMELAAPRADGVWKEGALKKRASGVRLHKRYP